jgi:hypothetical protein
MRKSSARSGPAGRGGAEPDNGGGIDGPDEPDGGEDAPDAPDEDEDVPDEDEAHDAPDLDPLAAGAGVGITPKALLKSS